MVRVAFDYGSPAHPYIQQVLPDELAIPPLQPGEQLWQADPATYQKVDDEGNWERATSAKIKDDSMDREVRAESSIENYGASAKTTDADSVEDVGGSKTIEAMGSAVVSAGADLGLISAGDANLSAMGDLIEVVGMARKSLATTLQQIQVQSGGRIWLGDNLVNVLKLQSDALAIISATLATLSTHSHAGDGAPPTEAAAFTANKTATDGIKLSLDSLTALTPQ